MNRLQEMVNIAEIHANRIQMALNELRGLLPFDEHKILTISHYNIMVSELLISRFAKLQDFIGNSIINELLKLTNDYQDNLTMIDKLNKLERLGIIGSRYLWEKMREVRNHVAHEYPDKPALAAMYLNQLIDLAPELLEILHRIKRAIVSYDSTY